MTRGNRVHGNRRNPQKKSIEKQRSAKHQTTQVIKANLEREEEAIEWSQRGLLEREQEREEQECRDRAFLKKGHRVPEKKPERAIFGANTNEVQNDMEAELNEYGFDEEGMVHRHEGVEPRLRRRPTQGDPFRASRRRMESGIAQRQATTQPTPDSPADREAGQQPATPAVSNAMPENGLEPRPRPTQMDPAKLAGIRQQIRDGRQQKAF